MTITGCNLCDSCVMADMGRPLRQWNELAEICAIGMHPHA